MDTRSNLLHSVFWMCGAMASFTLMAISGRELYSALDTFEIMLYRSLAGVIIVLSFSKYFGTLGEINLLDMKLQKYLE